MGDAPQLETPRLKGLVETIKAYAAGALGATRSRVDDFSAEVEFRTFRILWLIVWTLVAISSLSLAVALGVLTIIFGFHLPPKYMFGIPSLVFLVIAVVAMVMFQRTKHSRRKA